MNRRERRSAEKTGKSESDNAAVSAARPIPTMPIVGRAEKPGFILRVISRPLLSQFVLNRVRHPSVLYMLREVARQSGRMDALMRVEARLQSVSHH